MRTGKRLLYNTMLLTGSSLVMRCIGLAYQIWLVGRIGAAGIGLFQLVMSVSSLAITFAISGIRFACTRLISQEMGLGRYGGVGRTMHRCCFYSLFFGLAAACILYLCAEPIGFLWVGDARTVLSLKIIAVSLPFISLQSVVSGYFTATGRVYKTALSQISEQLLRIFLVIQMLKIVPSGDISLSCAAVVAAGTIAEVFALSLMVALYLSDRRKHASQGAYSPHLTGRMMSVALPLAVSSYARTCLSTLEHLLVPRGLKSAGFSSDKALEGYGLIQGMVFPIVSFPSCFLMALNEMIVPELTEAQVAGRTEYISHTATSLIHKCLIFAIGASTLMFTYADSLGSAIYNSPQAGEYIRIFSILTPIIYLDMVTDGCLKGLGQQMYSMAYNIMDAAISVTLVYTIIPKQALNGYIAIICFTECFNFFLSFYRLSKVTQLKLKPTYFLLPLLCALAAGAASKAVFDMLGINASESIFAVITALLLGVALYLSVLIFCGLIDFKKKNEN